MSIYSGVARSGRGVDIRTTQLGDTAATLFLAAQNGRKRQDGQQPTQQVRASLWGKQGEAQAVANQGSPVGVCD